MLYSNAIAAQAYDMGFEGIMADGNSRMMSNRHTNDLQCAPLIAKTKTIIVGSDGDINKIVGTME